jgi:hypothetical protein
MNIVILLKPHSYQVGKKGAEMPLLPIPNASSSSGAPKVELEKEYTHNLQQQIYFLELECQYLRMNKGGSGGSRENEFDGSGLPMSIQHQLRQVNLCKLKFSTIRKNRTSTTIILVCCSCCSVLPLRFFVFLLPEIIISTSYTWYLLSG